MIRPLPTLRIGSASAMAIDTDTVRILSEDGEAFRGLIAARAALVENRITRFLPPDRGSERLAEQTANLALDAMIELRRRDADREKALRHLELAAAMAITTINRIREE